LTANLLRKGLIEKPPSDGVITSLFKKGLSENDVLRLIRRGQAAQRLRHNACAQEGWLARSTGFKNCLWVSPDFRIKQEAKESSD